MGDRRAQLVTVTERLSEYDAVTDEETGEDNRHQATRNGVGGGTRHRFVDAQTRGTHQSHVVD